MSKTLKKQIAMTFKSCGTIKRRNIVFIQDSYLQDEETLKYKY